MQNFKTLVFKTYSSDRDNDFDNENKWSFVK
jgi:hypothetical protein